MPKAQQNDDTNQAPASSDEIQAEMKTLEHRGPAATPTSPSNTTFASLPLSTPTQRALLLNGFTTMTPIQKACIPHALAGRDILGMTQLGRCVFGVPTGQVVLSHECIVSQRQDNSLSHSSLGMFTS